MNPSDIIQHWINKGNTRSVLDLSNWNIETLPDIPDSVEMLNISGTNITRIEKLPSNLKWLCCMSSAIRQLPTSLPSSLIYLNCINCKDLEPFDVPSTVKIESDFKEYLLNKELLTQDHLEIAKKRISDWNKKKNPNVILDLSRLRFEYLPFIPDEVQWIICDGNKLLKSLKGLPRNLKRLSCSHYSQNIFDYLPDTLEYLRCNYSNISNIDNLPHSLKKLQLGYYSLIQTINILPPGLKHIQLEHASELRNITYSFPSSLRFIKITGSRLSVIPYIPDNLTYLDLSISDIVSIPNLPHNLKILDMRMTRIRSLPPLPDTLLGLAITSISIINNNSLPNSIRFLDSYGFKLEDDHFTWYCSKH
jgi:hypothetical protein